MRRELTVREYKTLEAVDLEPADVDALRAYAPRLTLRPSFRSGRFDITATSWIGAVQTKGLSLRIIPKLPVERVLFLISYVLDPDAWREDLFDFAAETSLIEALAPGFVRQARFALRRGLLRGYRKQEDALLTVKGRVRFEDQLRQRFGRMPPVEVSYDDYTEDINENRLLRAAVDRLLDLPIRSLDIRRQLRGIRWTLRDVAPLETLGDRLPSISFTRLNEHYRPAVRIAELILRGASIRHEHGTSRSSCFLIDMNAVFEEFVRIGLQEALMVPARNFPKPSDAPRMWLDRDRRIRLQPDLSWWVRGRPVFVGDVKYKETSGTGAQNADVYQALSYAIATELDSAMLIYANAAGRKTAFNVTAAKKQIVALGLDLEHEPMSILRQLEGIAADIVRHGRLGTSPPRSVVAGSGRRI